MSKVKEQNYLVIQGWMLSKLQLKGNDLLIYAIIYGFSQNTDCKFTGSLQYLADWTNSTKQGVINSLKNLLERELITKKDYTINSVKFVEYYSNDFNGVVNKVEQGYSNNFNGGSQITLPNNTNDKLIDNSINKKDKDTASGFSQNDFLENFIKERLGKMSESAKAGYYAFTVTQLESLAEKLGRPLTQMECQERCKMVLDGMYPEDETPVVKESFTTQNPTVKESLTAQKQKKEIEITKKDDIENFVRTFKASEFEVDGVIQLQSVFSENEIGLITQWILRRKETHKSKVKNTEQAITGVLNDILDIKKEIPLETIFEQRDGCYVHCGASGDASKTHQSIKLEYFTKLIKKPTFNNQYAKPKLSMSESADLMRQMAQYTKEQQEQLNQKEYEYPF